MNMNGININFHDRHDFEFIVSPAKQKRDICTAFPASLSSSSAAA